MSIEKFIDDQIKKAMADGEFDDLPGRGQPIDLEAYFQTPEDLRLCYSMLKNANFLPEEMQMLKNIEALRERLAVCTDEAERRRLNREVNEKTAQFNMLMEKNRQSR